MELSLLHMSTIEQAHDLLNALGCYSAGADLMAGKAVFLVIRVNGLLPQAANILKQEMLAKGGEVAVPSGALRMEAGRVDCIVMGTLSQYARLADILKQQPFELSDLANQLKLLAGLAAAHPARSWFGPRGDVAIGGLVDCDLQPPGVHDHAANAVALAWNLLEQRSDFLVVMGSNISMVQDVAQRLVGTAACPVAAWVPNSQPITLAPGMPVIAQQGCGPPSNDGPVLAMCTDEGAADFIEELVSAGVGAERLFITAMLHHGPSDTVSGPLVLVGLPRLDAVLVRQQDIAMLSMSTRASVLTRLVDRGASVFITDAPRHVGELLDAIREDPWNSSPT
ncbi:hypothetical protein [Candidatus Cryosericum terrychapinii]|uniref:Uncharacterized protein n=1 Tax=Candidatus Cryosericum terrychapinii TaxID=2290919 RepID=A0A398D0W6_9BACT|nr:hypothetical protein [Candidatus Cryosericum terrychapinii]RIE05777.1 hypothetical protein SMC7_06420 [Candidatus Cryosericum terrychapinii]